MSEVTIISPKVGHWTDRISRAWKEGVEAILETGRLISKAREDCNDEEWRLVIDELPFTKQHAYRLLAIGTDSRLVTHVLQLPSDTYTLYQLTRLPPQRFSDLCASGRIHPGMKRNEASAETRKERKEADEQRILSTAPAEGKHRALVIDPPWDYEWLSLAGRAAPGYAVMSHDELLAMDVAQWAEDDCHLYLWTTNNFMTRAVELMAHWGFQHKTVLTWVKPRWGLGAYFRNSTEHVLFGVRGELRTRSDSIATHFEAPLGEHSEKPEEFYEIVRQASYPSYGEAFQRKGRPDFQNLLPMKEVA